MTFNRPFCMFTLLATVGCDGFKGPDYSGELLASFEGVVRSKLSAAPGNAEVTIEWTTFGDQVDTVTSERVSVEVTFPSLFRLELFHPPEQAALNVIPGEPTFAIGRIAAFEGENLLGLSEDHMIGYLAEEAPEGSAAAAFLGVTDRGFHVLRVQHVAENAYDDCIDFYQTAEAECVAGCVDPAADECDEACDPVGGYLGSVDHEQPCDEYLFDRLSADPDGMAAQVTVTLDDEVGTLNPPNVY